MKKINIIKSALIFAVLTTSILTSCSIEKRVHLPGYHIKWNKKIDCKQSKLDLSENEEKELEKFQIENITCSNEDFIIVNEEQHESLLVAENKTTFISSTLPKMKADECDVIILRNGQEIKGKVLEIGQSEIKYKDCSNLNGPTISKNKNEVLKINYSNGTSTIMEESKTDSNNITVNVNTNNEKSTNKSLMVAALLWFFLGIIGVHRFYLGHVGMGILYLLTAGLCGIGWLIDGIMLLTGSLRPKHGEYQD